MAALLALALVVVAPQTVAAPGQRSQRLLPQSLAQNLQLAGTGLHASSGDLVAVQVREQSQGATDLNGDGDVQDVVLMIVDMATLGVFPVGDAFGGFAFVGDRLLADLSESRNGMTDLNGDGDVFDLVPHAFDGAGSVNLGLASTSTQELGSYAFVCAAERAGVDYNGDGDTTDQVWHVYDATSGALTNLALASADSFGLGMGRELCAFLVSEAAQGASDLNGDGDAADSVVFVHELSTGTTTNLGRAAFAQHTPSVHGLLVAFALREASQGFDANGDGDVADDVVHVHDHDTATSTNTGFAAQPPEIGPGAPAVAGPGFVAFVSDALRLRVFDAATGTAATLAGVPDVFSHRVHGSRVLFRASETGADLNGDGDLADAVLQVYDHASGATASVGWSAEHDVDVYGRLACFSVSESAQGGVDRNGDGDSADTVVALYDLATGRRRSTGLAIEPTFHPGNYSRVVGPQTAAVAVSEARQGAGDLDGDGDSTGLVLHFVEALGGRKRNAGHGLVAVDGRERWLTFLVPEQAADLNGDGDVLDQVLHAIRADI